MSIRSRKVVTTVATVVLALSIALPVNAEVIQSKEDSGTYGPNWIFNVEPAATPENPFQDDAPNTGEYRDDPSTISPEEVALDAEESAYYAPAYVDREYVVVNVNPKLHRYAVRSVEPTVVKMKKNVIFTQDYLITEEPLVKGEHVWLTFDEDESDGIDSDRADGLVYVTPQWAMDLPVAE